MAKGGQETVWYSQDLLSSIPFTARVRVCLHGGRGHQVTEVTRLTV